MAGKCQCCTHYETNVAARHEGDTRVRVVADFKNYLRVLDSSNSPGSQDQLLPGLFQVDDVDAIGLLLEDVLLHCGLAVV